MDYIWYIVVWITRQINRKQSESVSVEGVSIDALEKVLLTMNKIKGTSHHQRDALHCCQWKYYGSLLRTFWQTNKIIIDNRNDRIRTIYITCALPHKQCSGTYDQTKTQYGNHGTRVIYLVVMYYFGDGLYIWIFYWHIYWFT